MTNKILIVDDEPEIIKLVERILEYENLSLDIITASNGAEALERVISEMPDLILLDIKIPKINGYEVCRRVKSHTEYKSIKVVMFTAKAYDKDRRKAFRVGADGYFIKPFANKDLVRLINLYLLKKR
ncbi:MAG: response regulator [Candidatus Lokiarchaeota archaeon]|nr:response regulator [Candidatus Lokiarchaeota archaeon]